MLRKLPSSFVVLLFSMPLFLPLQRTQAQSGKGDVEEQVNQAMETGNAGELARHFTDKVDLKIPDTDDVFSQAQAEQILKDFFKENEPEDLILEHSGTSKLKDRYRIGKLVTSSGDLRVTYFMKKVDGDPRIKKLRIEPYEGDP